MTADTQWDFDDEPETEPRDRSKGKANAEPPGSKPADQPWHENIKTISWPDKTGWSAPYRRFVAKGWIPVGCVTSLYGCGGIGKSLLAQLLGTAASLGRRWLGIETEQCKVLALFCEDDEHELWRRQERINGTYAISMADLADFQPDARTGGENVLVHGTGVLQTTKLFDHLAQAIAELKPGLVILDNIAQLFGGSENDRAHVTQFVNYLARIARDGDCAVVLLGHVAKAEGSEYSGSTAWDAAVRSRLLLAHEGQGDDRRLFLRKPKANYSENDAIELEWRDGMLHAVNQYDDTPSSKLERGLRDGQANQVFLNALDVLRDRGMAASESVKAAQTYAPRLIVAQGLAGEFSKRDMQAAMERLFKEGRIKASMVVVKGANRHKKTGIGRIEWEWPDTAPKGEPEGASAPHTNGEGECL
jgi:RecA-family ATPase